MKQLLLALLSLLSIAASYRTQHFVVTAPDDATAHAVAESAEYWLKAHGSDLLGDDSFSIPYPCSVVITLHELGKSSGGGSTTFGPVPGGPIDPTGRWMGPPDKLIDDVVPHEVLHLVLSKHFGQPVPRWFDEGMCVCSESQSAQDFQLSLLNQCMTNGQSFPFNEILRATDYPTDGRVMYFYAQGWSMTQYLIALKGNREAINFMGSVLNSSNDYDSALRNHYGIQSRSEFQLRWVEWLKSGRPGMRHESDRLFGCRPWLFNRQRMGYVQNQNGGFDQLRRIGRVRGPVYAAAPTQSVCPNGQCPLPYRTPTATPTTIPTTTPIVQVPPVPTTIPTVPTNPIPTTPPIPTTNPIPNTPPIPTTVESPKPATATPIVPQVSSSPGNGGSLFGWLLPVILSGLGLSTATSAFYIGRGIYKWVASKPAMVPTTAPTVTTTTSEPSRTTHSRVVVDTPPPPQITNVETRYAPYETDRYRKAHVEARTQLVRKFPGAHEILEAERSLIDQYLAGGV